MLRSVILGIALFFLTSTELHGQNYFGRYVGVLRHSQIAQDQLAKLDFVVSRQNGQELKLIGVLSLYFGDFESTEQVSYHFDSVTYNLVTGTLVFDQPDQDITFVVSRFGGGNLEGTLRSATAGNVGALEMTQSNTVTPTRPLVQPLWGEYRGMCDDVLTVMQVQTHRSSGDSSRMGNPFGTYDTTAQLAEVDPICGDTNLCVMRVYESGSYNFFNGQLQLLGQIQSTSCTVGATSMECGACVLNRTSTEAAGPGPKTYPLQPGGPNNVPPPGGSNPAASGAALAGVYKGYLYHERLGVYQPVTLNIVAYQRSNESGRPALFVSATSALYFGDFNSLEYVTQRFNEKEYPLLAPQIVLERLDDDVDAIAQLTQLGNGVARGVWYSSLIGRIGSFELVNSNNVPPLPTNAIVMQPLAGRYQGGMWNLDLRVVREATPVNTVNPFYPLNFRGTFRLSDITANTQITQGSYDFYSGKIMFELENSSLFSGFRSDDGVLKLKRPTPGTIRPLQPHRYQSFMRVNP